MEYTNSLAANAKCYELGIATLKLRYNPDLQKLLGNIRNMVTELSKKEVEARRLHSTQVIEKQLKELNDAIKHYEQLLLVAQIMN